MGSPYRLRTCLPAQTSRKTSARPSNPYTPAHGRLHHHSSRALAIGNPQPSGNDDRSWSTDARRGGVLPTLHGHCPHLRNDSLRIVGIPFQQADETQGRCYSCKSDGQSSIPLSHGEDWASVSEHNDPRTAIPDLSARATQCREENRGHSSSGSILAETGFPEYLVLLEVTLNQMPMVVATTWGLGVRRIHKGPDQGSLMGCDIETR